MKTNKCYKCGESAVLSTHPKVFFYEATWGVRCPNLCSPEIKKSISFMDLNIFYIESSHEEAISTLFHEWEEQNEKMRKQNE